MMPFRSAVVSKLPLGVRRRLQDFRVTCNVKHVCGKRSLRLAPDEAVVTCVVRNGEYYIQSFIDHYLRMGFRHIFLLDNGSTDETITLATSSEHVTVFQSHLPISSNQRLFKRYLAATCCKGGWCLDADIDEFFDYPFSEQLSLRDFLRYMNASGFTAVMTQLLDMFSEHPLSHLSSSSEDRLVDLYRFYDLADVTMSHYSSSPISQQFGPTNKLSNDKSSLCWGGMRKMLYGNNCLLTKHSLFRPSGGVEPFPHVHFVNNAHLADVSAVMKHYKLTSCALAATLQNRDNFLQNGESYQAFLDFLEGHPQQELTRGTTRTYTTATELLANDFLFMSGKYESYARAKGSRASLSPLRHRAVFQ